MCGHWMPSRRSARSDGPIGRMVEENFSIFGISMTLWWYIYIYKMWIFFSLSPSSPSNSLYFFFYRSRTSVFFLQLRLNSQNKCPHSFNGWIFSPFRPFLILAISSVTFSNSVVSLSLFIYIYIYIYIYILKKITCSVDFICIEFFTRIIFLTGIFRYSGLTGFNNIIYLCKVLSRRSGMRVNS